MPAQTKTKIHVVPYVQVANRVIRSGSVRMQKWWNVVKIGDQRFMAFSSEPFSKKQVEELLLG
jgi:hypothetical protein